MKRLVIAAVLLMLPLFAEAQKVVEASGSYTYVVPSDVSMDEARAVAVERAQVEIIAAKFGTVMDMSNFTTVRNSGNTSSVDMYSIGQSEVKGIWLRDLTAPEFKYGFTENGNPIVTVTLHGEIREVKHADIGFEAKVLCNGIADSFERYDFKDGDDLYMSFESPVSGYLAVYLEGPDGTVARLLPHSGQKEGYFKVRANKRYLLFSSASSEYCAGTLPELVDTYELTTSHKKEINTIYVVFSPEIFTRAIDHEDAAHHGVQIMDGKDFHKWLIRCRLKDEDMSVQTKKITITK